MSDDGDADRKRVGELAYWTGRKDAEDQLENSWFESFYTEHFGLTLDDYTDKRVLDIGCGPRGSLEWATMARERVGVDPLADDYLQMGAADHAMTYVAAGAESIPFPDHSFDIVCSFNSLDHVDDLDAAIAEMKRLTALGGLLLVLTDVHEEPTPQEPICFDWDVVERFAPEFAMQSLRCCEKLAGGAYASAAQGVLFDHADSRPRYGVLSARFMRVEVPDVPHDSTAPLGREDSLLHRFDAAASLERARGLAQESAQLAARAVRGTRIRSRRLAQQASQRIRSSLDKRRRKHPRSR